MSISIKLPNALKGDNVAKKEWRRIVKCLSDLNFLISIDLPALTLYCVVYSEWKYATGKVREQGVILRLDTGHWTQNPWGKIQTRRFKELRQRLNDFGLTPVSRQGKR